MHAMPFGAGSQKLGREVTLSVTIVRHDVVGENKGLGFKARLSGTESSQHVEYILNIELKGETWQARKRFSEFAALHDTLRKRLSSVPELPAKTVIRQFSQESLAARTDGLARYLQDLCRRQDALNCPEVWEFFELPREKLDGFDPVQVAEIQESPPACLKLRGNMGQKAVFGVIDFGYDPERGLLLIGSSDCSWASRADTKFTNMKMPWEPAAPSLPVAQMSLWRQSSDAMTFEVAWVSRFYTSISCIAISPDTCFCGLVDGSVGFHTTVKGGGHGGDINILPSLKHAAAIVAIAYVESDHWIITASKDRAVKVYDARLQTLQCEFESPSPVTAMHYSPDHRRCFCGMASGHSGIWDMSCLPARHMSQLPDDGERPQDGEVRALAYDQPTGTLFAAAREGLTLWAVKASVGKCWGRRTGQIKGISCPPTSVAWAGSSRELLAGFRNGAITVFDADRGTATYCFQAHDDAVTALLFLDGPRRLVSSSKDKTVKMWDFPSLANLPLEGELGVPKIQVSVPAHAAAGLARASPSAQNAGGGEPAQRGGNGYPTEAAASAASSGAPLASSGSASAVPRQTGKAATNGTCAASPLKVLVTVAGQDDSDDDLSGWAS